MVRLVREMRGKRECVGVCTHACEWEGRVGGGGVVERGQSDGKTQKTKGCASCAITATAHLLFGWWKRDSRDRDRQTDRRRERDGEGEKEG